MYVKGISACFIQSGQRTPERGGPVCSWTSRQQDPCVWWQRTREFKSIPVLPAYTKHAKMLWREKGKKAARKKERSHESVERRERTANCNVDRQFALSDGSTSSSVKESAAVLFYCEAPENVLWRVKRLQTSHWYGCVQIEHFHLWVNLSFKNILSFAHNHWPAW